MGFDLHGIAPTSEKGKYFRNSIWWWGKLWDFACYVDQDALTDEQKFGGRTNDAEVTEEASQELAKRLFDALDHREEYSNWVKEYHGPCVAIMASVGRSMLAPFVGPNPLPDFALRFPDGVPNESSFPFSWDNVRRFAEFCADSGGFIIR